MAPTEFDPVADQRCRTSGLAFLAGAVHTTSLENPDVMRAVGPGLGPLRSQPRPRHKSSGCSRSENLLDRLAQIHHPPWLFGTRQSMQYVVDEAFFGCSSRHFPSNLQAFTPLDIPFLCSRAAALA